MGKASLGCAAAMALTVLAGGRLARGQSPPPLTRNDYALELFQGPVIAPIRITGIGGAYTGYAEGVEGTASNAAAPAMREPFSLKWFDYDVTLGLSFPGAYGGTDFDNRGDQGSSVRVARVDRFLHGNIGAQAQFGSFGASATGELVQYDLTAPGTPALTLQYARWNALAAYGFVDNQIVVGGGIRGATLQVTENGVFDGDTLLTMTGIGPQVGVVVKPNETMWRIGVTARAPVRGVPTGSDRAATDANGVKRAGTFILPSRVVQPWELEAGVALQLGPRPLNPRWINAHEQEAGVPGATEEDKQRLLAVRRARYENWPRGKLLLLAAVLVTGTSDSAVGLGGFLDQKRDEVGSEISVTPRLGLEGEPVANRLVMRLGGYLEPSRFHDSSARQHFTFGGDVKLFDFDAWGLIAPTTWRASFAVDLAPRYENIGIGIGAWH